MKTGFKLKGKLSFFRKSISMDSVEKLSREIVPLNKPDVNIIFASGNVFYVVHLRQQKI